MRKFEIQDKSVILKWIILGFCFICFMAFGSIYIYRAVINTEWYHTKQLKKAFKEEYVHVNDYEQIIYVGISPKGDEDSWQYFYDVPDNLFNDLTCDNFIEIDNPELVEQILGYDWIMVVFKDASKSIYFIFMFTGRKIKF